MAKYRILVEKIPDVSEPIHIFSDTVETTDYWTLKDAKRAKRRLIQMDKERKNREYPN